MMDGWMGGWVDGWAIYLVKAARNLTTTPKEKQLRKKLRKFVVR